uniref:CCHC-type domain-containing protein n=1 Tax=Xenopus tropicalis TaxID=8364 RepID=A0A803KDP5_XENTR
MPLFCRNCLRFGHTQDACPEGKLVRCNGCGRPGHVAAFCQFQKTCNMCGKEGHIYKDCPTKNCPRSKACNLCGLASHVYRDSDKVCYGPLLLL